MTEETDRERSEAYVTLATNDSYSVGALVLGQSLRNTGTRRQLIIMVTNQVTNQMREQLRETFDSLVVVDVLDSRDVANLNLLQRPDLGLTFTKLHCWRLTQFSKCVFLDADTLVLHNIDELFDCEELAAAPDVGWPDCFNSGVFVYRPSQETYSALINLALTRGSFDGGDQGLLNQYFSDWSTQGRTRRLPFIYNTVAQAFYSYSPAYKQYGHNVKVIHFVGSVKPWNVGYNTATRTLEGGPYQSTEFLQHWWNLFMDKVHHRLSDNLRYLVNAYHYLPLAVVAQPLRHQEPISYSMTSPYIPPDISVFYEPPPESTLPPERFEPVPEVPVDRHYSHLESFYAEPPMTNIDSHSHFYSAKEFHQTWTDFGQTESKPDPAEIIPAEDHIGETIKQNEENLEGKQEEEEVHQAAHDDDDNNRQQTHSVVAEDESKSTLGSVGSPGHHVVGGEAWFPGNYTQQQLSDGHRQYDWERGQIDYMGMDSFDNIMRQIDTKIQPTAAPLVAASGVTGAPLASAGAPGYSGTNGPTVGPPGPKSRVLQALENQFREGSEFRKSSTESVSPVPPRKSVHRATVMLSPKVYREQVINKAAAAVSKTTSVKQPAGATAKPVVEKQPAAAVQQPVAGVQHPAAAVQQPVAGVQHPAAAVQQPVAGVQHPAAAVQQPVAGVQHPAAAVQQPVAGVQHPAAAVHQPIADVQQPAATVQQPITSVQQPRAAVQSPASSISTSPASPAAQGYGIASPNGTPSHLGAAFVQSPVGVQSPPVGGDVGGAYVQVQAQSGLPTQDDSGFVGYSADTTFGSGGSPLAFSTPAPGGAHFPHTGQHGHQQYGAKISPSSPPALPVDPFSVEASLTPDYPSAFAASDPFQAPGSFDPFAQGPKPGLGVSVHGSMPTGEATAHGPGTVHQTPTHGGAEVQFESHSGDQHHRAKRGGKRSKK